MSIEHHVTGSGCERYTEMEKHGNADFNAAAMSQLFILRVTKVFEVPGLADVSRFEFCATLIAGNRPVRGPFTELVDFLGHDH